MKNLDKIIFVVLVFLIVGFVFFSGFSRNRVISGKAINDIILIQKLRNLTTQMKVFLILWVLVLLFILFLIIKYLKEEIRNKKNFQSNIVSVHKKGGLTYTDLDNFYKMLLANEKLKISTIAKSFDIPKEKALEWSKIFEEEGLVTINYPAFLEPEVILKAKKDITQKKKLFGGEEKSKENKIQKKEQKDKKKMYEKESKKIKNK